MIPLSEAVRLRVQAETWCAWWVRELVRDQVVPVVPPGRGSVPRAVRARRMVEEAALARARVVGDGAEVEVDLVELGERWLELRERGGAL